MDEGNVVLPTGRFFGAVDDRWSTGLVTLSIVRHAQPQTPTSPRHLLSAPIVNAHDRNRLGQRQQPAVAAPTVVHPVMFDDTGELVRENGALESGSPPAVRPSHPPNCA